ncbi:hypothetical protein BCR33DRAFT_712929 [Rhizoclosmatium globosum]|uniref:Uncharacterized protein n=1 Tax=Rhizoclosmatium globosum TaxID=329046 RepID=A0A1Y2CVR6_9FUNG|nr:hypothetical protein BCR33DRAFT_712929 [Rhizoclosmatium globosum]|eukprot:ORY50976.1 hypothetical protein BCR33DRAFT_712929 [Rhizoclosmatium globosum]
MNRFTAASRAATQSFGLKGMSPRAASTCSNFQISPTRINLASLTANATPFTFASAAASSSSIPEFTSSKSSENGFGSAGNAPKATASAGSARSTSSLTTTCPPPYSRPSLVSVLAELDGYYAQSLDDA